MPCVSKSKKTCSALVFYDVYVRDWAPILQFHHENFTDQQAFLLRVDIYELVKEQYAQFIEREGNEDIVIYKNIDEGVLAFCCSGCVTYGWWRVGAVVRREFTQDERFMPQGWLSTPWMDPRGESSH